jgi:hypothetical protein
MQGTEQKRDRSIRHGFTGNVVPQLAHVFVMAAWYHYLGSGTLLLLASETHFRLLRSWIGCDLGYQDLQAKRLEGIQRELIQSRSE